jgi:hypothetical protein
VLIIIIEDLFDSLLTNRNKISAVSQIDIDEITRLVIDFQIAFLWSSSVACPPPRWCLHFFVVVGPACLEDPESYAGSSVATGRVSHARQVKGDRPD